MLEIQVESRLKRLEDYGFKVLKLRTPGNSGVMDRLILRPKYCPGPPSFVEIKKPGKTERALQISVRDDWRGRGCIVHEMRQSYKDIDDLITLLFQEVKTAYFEGINRSS
jgi:hypothetical protein